MGLMIWCNTRENKWQVSDAEGAAVYKKIRDNRRLDSFRNMKTTLSNGEEIQLIKTFVGYDCKICGKEHIIHQKCDMEIVGNCLDCNKPVQRFVNQRNALLGADGIFCMVHRPRAKTSSS